MKNLIIFKKIMVLIFVSLSIFFSSYAQDQPDTLKTKELNEVVVQAQMHRTSSAKLTYTPSAKQKMQLKTLWIFFSRWLSLKSG